MDKEIKSRILEQVGDVAEMTKQGLVKAVEIMQEQAPELVREVLAWNFALSLLIFLSGLLVAGGVMVAMPIVYRAIKKSDLSSNRSYDPCNRLFVHVGWVVVFFAVGIGIDASNFTWLQIWIAPRLFLLEYVSNLIN